MLEAKKKGSEAAFLKKKRIANLSGFRQKMKVDIKKGGTVLGTTTYVVVLTGRCDSERIILTIFRHQVDSSG